MEWIKHIKNIGAVMVSRDETGKVTIQFELGAHFADLFPGWQMMLTMQRVVTDEEMEAFALSMSLALASEEFLKNLEGPEAA